MLFGLVGIAISLWLFLDRYGLRCMFFGALSMALSSANLALISQYIGAKEFEVASRAASRNLTVSVIFGFLLGVIYIVLRPIISTYTVRAPQVIRSDVYAYAEIIAIDMTISYLFNNTSKYWRYWKACDHKCDEVSHQYSSRSIPYPRHKSLS